MSEKKPSKVSKGIHSSVSRKWTLAVRRDRTAREKMAIKIDAWKRKKNPWISIPNPEDVTNKRFIRVRAEEVWGSPIHKFEKMERAEKEQS